MSESANKNPLRRLADYGQEYQKQALMASAASVLNRLFDLAPPILIGMAVDVVVSQQNSFLGDFGITDPVTQLWMLGILTLIVWGFESLFQYIYGVLWRNLAQSIEHDLRQDAYDHLQEMDMAYLEDQSTGGLMAILNDDINQLERFLDYGANDILQLITSIIVIGIMFFVLAPSVAWMAILPMPFVFYGSVLFQTTIGPALYGCARTRCSAEWAAG